MSDDVVLVGHGLPLPVLLLYVLLQVEAALLRNVVLLEERLRKGGGGGVGEGERTIRVILCNFESLW